jgi:RNA binding exosome subunit
MAGRSRGFRELLRQSRSQAAQRKGQEELRQRAQNGFLGDQVKQIVVDPKGVQKMSEVLEEFVEPYLPSAQGHQQTKALFAMAIVAWNISLLPDAEQRSHLENVSQKVAESSGSQDCADIREELQRMVDRRKKYFSYCNRRILDFELTESADDYHLSVISTLDQPG